MDRKAMVAGNWKMNGSREYVSEVSEKLNALSLSGIDIAVCPPTCFIPLFTERSFYLAGQDVSRFENGAHTGEVSAAMLADFNCEYVIVGHSERRQDCHESSNDIAQKALIALEHGIKPIICVGEPLEVRKAGNEKQFVAEQLTPVLALLSQEQLSECVIAYEPIWAIGTGETASPEQAQSVHEFIRQQVAQVSDTVATTLRILYGGSVKPDNANELFAQKDIDGGLIGGACLSSDSFVAVCKAAV